MQLEKEYSKYHRCSDLILIMIRTFIWSLTVFSICARVLVPATGLRHQRSHKWSIAILMQNAYVFTQPLDLLALASQVHELDHSMLRSHQLMCEV